MLHTGFFADVIASQFLPKPIGVVFFLFVLIAESLLISKCLSGRWGHVKIWKTVMFVNLITTLLGLAIYKQAPGILSYVSIDSYRGDFLVDQTKKIFLESFLLTILIELPVIAVILRKEYAGEKLLLYSLLANLLTYTTAGAIFLMFYFQIAGSS
jgi:hypothetical protein